MLTPVEELPQMLVKVKLQTWTFIRSFIWKAQGFFPKNAPQEWTPRKRWCCSNSSLEREIQVNFFCVPLSEFLSRHTGYTVGVWYVLNVDGWLWADTPRSVPDGSLWKLWKMLGLSPLLTFSLPEWHLWAKLMDVFFPVILNLVSVVHVRLKHNIKMCNVNWTWKRKFLFKYEQIFYSNLLCFAFLLREYIYNHI